MESVEKINSLEKKKEEKQDLFEIKAILSMNLKKESNSILGVEGRTKKIIDYIAAYLLVLLAGIFYITNFSGTIKTMHLEGFILQCIVGVQMTLVALFDFYKIVNSAFLSNDFKEMMIFPIHAKNLFYAKVLYVTIINCMINLLCYIMMLIVILISGYSVPGGIPRFFVQNFCETLLLIVYLYTIGLTILTMVGFVTRSMKWKNNLILLGLYDVFVIAFSILLYKMPHDDRYMVGMILFVVLSFVGLYDIGGNSYAQVFKNLTIQQKDRKASGTNINRYKYKKKNDIWAFINRDFKIMLRTPTLLFTYVIFLVTLVGLGTILMIVFSKKISDVLGPNYNIIWYQFILVMYIGVVLTVGEYALSKEGAFRNTLKALPIRKEKIVLVKYLHTLILELPIFICVNVLFFVFPVSIKENILYELFIICYCLVYPFIIIEQDFHSPITNWNTTKELFSDMKVVRAVIPLYGTLTISMVIFLVYNFVSWLNYAVYIILLFAIPIMYGLFSLKRMKKNLKKWYD